MGTYLGLSVILFGLLLVGCAAPTQRDATASLDTASTPSLTPRTDLIAVGERAPDFELIDQNEKPFRLSAKRGRPVVLIFYPGDMTPGCTKQLCAVRDDWPQFRRKHVLVAGVNPGSKQLHTRFAETHGFPFPLLIDTDQHVAAAYGCKGESGYPQRTVYAIDAKGRVVFAQRGMPSDADILASLK